MINFAPHVYIALGENARRFSLMKTAIQTVGLQQNVVALHVQVLSPKLSRAVVQAYEYAKEHGVDFKYDPKIDIFPADLDEVYQAKRNAKVSKKQAKLDAEQQRQSAYDTEKRARHDAKCRILDSGIYPFGKHMEGRIIDFPDYGAFLVSKKAEFEKDSLLEYAVQVIEEKFPQILKAAEESDYTPGHRPEKEKTRIRIKGTVQRVMRFDSHFGGWTYWVFIRDESGLCIVSKGSWQVEKGDEVDINALLKAKEVYKGQDQTIINRVKAS